MKPIYQYAATVLRVIDADTLEVDTDLGRRTHLQPDEVRIYGIDAPERFTDAGKTATAFVHAWITNNTIAQQVIIRTFKPTAHGGDDKYGRWLALVYSPATDEELGAAMIAAGHAVPYFGGPR